MPLPRCFFDIAINGVPTGRIVFELFSDVCPLTCENFRCLCTGEKGEGKTTFKPLHLKGTPIHRIVKGFIVQGGDFVNGDGTGGESIYGGLFNDESLKLKHDQGFLLSMANKGPDTNGSQFFITTAPAPHLDGIHVIFGRVVDGQEFVTEMENQKVDANHRPYADVRITNCGELVLLRRGKKVKSKQSVVAHSSESDTEESSSEAESSTGEDGRKKRKRRHKKKHSKKKTEKRSRKEKKRKKHNSKKHKKRQRKNSGSNDASGSSEGEREGEGEEVGGGVAAVSTISAGDLPDEGEKTSRPSWLYRSSRSPSPRANNDEEKSGRASDKPSFIHRNEVSVSGRKIKGRGLMRYRTPPRESGHRQTETQRDYHDERSRRERDQTGRERDQTGRDNRRRSRSRERHSTQRRRSHSRDRQQRERSRSRERQHNRRSRSNERRWKRSRSGDRERDRGRRYDHRSRSSERRRERSRSDDRDRGRSRRRDRQRSWSTDRRRNDHRRDRESRDRSSRERDSTRDRLPSSRNPSRTAANDERSNHDNHTTDRRLSVHEENSMTVDKERKAPGTSAVPADEKRQSKSSWSYNHEDNWHSSPPRPSRWDRRGNQSSDDSGGNNSGADEEDRELEQAYQNVERTLAEQQFGISSLFD